MLEVYCTQIIETYMIDYMFFLFGKKLRGQQITCFFLFAKKLTR